jgi:O-antigen ligase
MRWRMSTAASENRDTVLPTSAMILVGFAPIFMIILPWDIGPEMNPYRGLMRGLSLSVTLLELTFVLLAIIRGFSIISTVRRMPEWSKAGISLSLALILFGAVYSAKSPILALIGFAKLVTHALFFFAVIDRIKLWQSKQLDRLWAVIGIGLIAYWAAWLTIFWVIPPAPSDWLLLVPGVTNVRSLGFFALAGFFAGMATASGDAHHNRRVQYLLGLTISVAALVMVIWTGSRGGLLAILSGLGFLLLADHRLRLWLAKFSALGLLLAMIISLPLPVVHPSYGGERIISSSTPTNKGTEITSGRREMWENTAKKISEKPLTGWGVEQFAISGPEQTLGYKQPHNMILQLLFSTGLLGALAALLIIAPFLPMINRNLSTPHRRAAWGYFIGALTFGLIDAAFYYTYPVMVFLVALAILLTPTPSPTASDRSG